MTYGYLRVSTGKQDVENQKFGVIEEARRRDLVIDEYITDENISGGVEPDKRKLGKLLKRLKSGDVLIAGEISRLGRSLFMVMRILEHCMNNGVSVYTHKDGYELGDNIQSKVLAFAFGLAAEIERKMISDRTKEALQRKRDMGVILGRPVGRRSSKVKLTGKEQVISELLDQGVPLVHIAKIYKVHRMTLTNFMKTRMPDDEAAVTRIAKTKAEAKKRMKAAVHKDGTIELFEGELSS